MRFPRDREALPESAGLMICVEHGSWHGCSQCLPVTADRIAACVAAMIGVTTCVASGALVVVLLKFLVRLAHCSLYCTYLH